MKKLIFLSIIIGLTACDNTAAEQEKRYTETFNHCSEIFAKETADKVCDCWAKTVANATTENVDISHCVNGTTLITKD